MGSAHVDATLDRSADVVAVDVAVKDAVAADDHDRIADLGPRGLEAGDRFVGRIEQEHDLVAQVGNRGFVIVAIGTLHLEFRRRLHIGFGERAFVDDVERRIEKEQETRTAGVDHTGIGEHLEQGRRALQRLAPFGTGGSEDPEQIGAGLGGRDCSLARLAHDGEDRAFHRVADCAVRTLGGGSQRRGEGCAVDRCRIGDGGGEATKNLRHDHPAVATGAHEGAMGDGLAHRCHVGVGAVEFVDDRAQGERHVGAGVAVRDGVHVQVVHRLAVVDERVAKDGDDLAECSGIENVQRHGFGSYKADVAGGTLTEVRFAACRV